MALNMDYHTSYTMESFTAAPDHITTVENLPEKSAKSNGGARKALTMRKLGASLPPSRAALTNEDLVIDNLLHRASKMVHHPRRVATKGGAEDELNLRCSG